MRVERMFVSRSVVEVYSVSSDGKHSMRNLVPMSMIRLVEEWMPVNAWVEELETSEFEADERRRALFGDFEEEEEEGEVEPGPGDEPMPEPSADQSNGQITSP
jgi:hypothetical protein